MELDFRKKNGKKNKMSIGVYFLWALYAGVALSGWSYYLLCDVIGFPFYLYEIFFIPPIIIYRNTLFKMFTKIRKSYIISFILLIGFLLLGCILNPQYIVAQITTYRTLVYVWCFMYIFSWVKSFNLELLQALCVGASLGQMMYILLISSDSDQTAVNIVALALMIIIPAIKNNIKEIVLFTILGLVIAFRSSFRINIVIVILALFIALLYMALIKKRIKAVLTMICIVIGLFLVVQNFDFITTILADVFNMDNDYALYRVTYRLEQLLQMDFAASQDTMRFELIGKIITEFDDYIIPTGLIGKAIGEYGLYKDAPIMFFYSAFGSWVSIVLLGGIVVGGVKFLCKSFRLKNTDMAVFAIMLPVFLFLFVLNGTFIMATYEACLTGLILGYWYNKNKIET